MKIQSKEELIKELQKLKNKKLDNAETYISEKNFIANCYFVSPDAFYFKEEYIGKRICAECKESFGEELKECISKCQKEKYQVYLNNNYLVGDNRLHPCFKWIHNKESNNYKRNIKLLKHKHIEILNLDIKEDAWFGVGRKSFTKILTEQEWISMCGECLRFEKEEYSPCFEKNNYYRNIERIEKSYKKAGFDVTVNYYCSKCCKEKGKHPIEFCLKLKDNENLYISYPQVDKEDNNNICSTSDYEYVLEVLKGNGYGEQSGYQIPRKALIDNSLNKILNLDIRYSKKQVEDYFIKRYDHQGSLGIDFYNENIASLLNDYNEDYMFTVEEFLKLHDETNDINSTCPIFNRDIYNDYEFDFNSTNAPISVKDIDIDSENLDGDFL